MSTPDPVTIPRKIVSDTICRIAMSRGLEPRMIQTSKIAPYAHARQDVMLALSRVPERYGPSAIGRALRRDHASVIHGIKQARLREQGAAGAAGEVG